MERFDAHVGSVNAALQQAPEGFEPIRVDVSLNVTLHVIHDLMDEFLFHSPIAHGFIGKDLSASLNILANVLLHYGLGALGDHGGTNLTSAF